MNQSLHFCRYGFFASLDQVKQIVQAENYIFDSNGNIIVDIPNFLKSVTNLSYSILYHHGINWEEKYITKNIQASFSLEPQNISNDIKSFQLESNHNEEEFFMILLQI